MYRKRLSMMDEKQGINKPDRRNITLSAIRFPLCSFLLPFDHIISHLPANSLYRDSRLRHALSMSIISLFPEYLPINRKIFTVCIESFLPHKPTNTDTQQPKHKSQTPVGAAVPVKFLHPSYPFHFRISICSWTKYTAKSKRDSLQISSETFLSESLHSGMP